MPLFVLSGSGKSTIAKLIASLWDVKDGSIKIGDVDIRDLSLEGYNRMIAYVSPDNYLFNDTWKDFDCHCAPPLYDCRCR